MREIMLTYLSVLSCLIKLRTASFMSRNCNKRGIFGDTPLNMGMYSCNILKCVILRVNVIRYVQKIEIPTLTFLPASVRYEKLFDIRS